MITKLPGSNEPLQKGAIWGWMLGAIALLLLVLTIPYITGQNVNFTTNTTIQEPQGGGPGVDDENAVALTDIIENVDGYLGRTVTVDGEIETVYNQRVFRLDQETAVVGDEILVVTRGTTVPEDVNNTADFLFEDAQDVRVTGQVQRLVVVEVERDVDLDLDPQIETEFEGQPIIVADQVTRLPENR